MTDILIGAVGLLAAALLFLMMKKRKGHCLSGSCDGCPVSGNCSIRRSEKRE